MRMRHVMAVCLASLAVSSSLPQSLLACDRCRSGQACRSCQPSDDRGLLDMLDSVLVRRRPQLSPVTIPQLPSLDGSLCRAMSRRVACRCGAGPRCGCELNNEPTCGCELHQAARHKTHGPVNSGAATSPQPTPSDEHRDNSHLERDSKTYTSSPSDAVEQDSYRINAPRSLPEAPLPRHLPTETVPRPDSEVDPFLDESAKRVRRVPARAVQRTQPQRDYRQNYDAQARHEAVHMSLSDDTIGGQPQMTADSNYAQRQSLDVNGSSRRRVVEPTRTANERQPEVISASGKRALSYGHSSSVADSGDDSGNSASHRRTQPQPIEVANPLRRNSH